MKNYINSELSRLYKNNQMIQGLGMTYEVLELALKQICNNNSLITRAVQYAKDTYQDRLIDLIGVAGIVRKFKLFEIDTYSSYYIKSEWEQSSSENESEDSSLSHESLENSNEFTAIKDHIFKPSITP